MTNTGFTSPSNRICFGGSPIVQELKVETATNMYPGRLVVRGTNDDDIVVADGIKPVCGMLAYNDTEDQNPEYMPTSITTAYAANAQVPVLAGRFLGKIPGGLALGTVAKKNDILLSWSNGQVVPGVCMGGKYAVKIPFSNTSGTTLVDTGVDIPGGVLITDCMLNVTTLKAGATLDVGFENAVESGDLDGLLDGASCAAAGIVFGSRCDIDVAGADTITSGALLKEILLTDATSSPNAYTYSVPVPYRTDGTIKSIVYTPSNHAFAGDIWLFVESPGIVPVGRAGNSVSAASAAADIQIVADI